MKRRNGHKLFITDRHYPYHNSRAISILYQAGELLQPDTVIDLGDTQDCYAVSRFPKTEERKANLQDEAMVTLEALVDQRERFPHAEMVWLLGNHDARPKTYLAERAPEMLPFYDHAELYNLRALRIKAYPYKYVYKVSEYLYATHGEYTNVAKQFHAVGDSVVFGHTHRIETQYFNNALGRPHVAATAGWLGDWEQAEGYRGGNFAKSMLGFATARVANTGTFHLHVHPIVKIGNKYQCDFYGHLLTA